MSRSGSTASASENGGAQSPRKRSVDEVELSAELNATPTKRRRSSLNNGEPIANGGSDSESDDDSEDETALNGSRRKTNAEEGTGNEEETPQVTPRKRGRPPKNRTPGPQTPVKGSQSLTSTPRKQAADRSARKKSARALIEHVVRNGVSDGEDDGEDDGLAREIYESSEEDDEDEERDTEDARSQVSEGQGDAAATTPTKKRRGRPPGWKKARSPTPPRDLPPHEQYFLDNKPGRPRTSNNTLASLALLTHEEYFEILRGHTDRHAADVENLETLHVESFPQWGFELSQGFGLCMHGYGSKRGLLRRFAKWMYAHGGGGMGSYDEVKADHKIVVVNGYAATTTIREALSVIGKAVDPAGRITTAQPTIMVQKIISHLTASMDTAAPITLTLIINSLDAPPLRKPGTQAILAQLAALQQVNLVCSVDTPDFSLLWDVGVRSAFNFAFHDCTTFAPFTAELDVVDEVHELLGRKARRVNGREGVAFVLRSLPENAKNLFRLLVGEVLIAMEDEDGGAGGGGEDAGVEYRMVYNKAVEEFICTSEMAFRTLLKEFHDHQIITSRKDALGTELLSLPFGKEELEAILEDLMS